MTLPKKIQKLRDDLAERLDVDPEGFLTGFNSAAKIYEERRGSLFNAIAHGDAAHRAWLKKAIKDHFAGKPVDRPEGRGTAEIYEERERKLVEAFQKHFAYYGAEKVSYIPEILEKNGIECFPQYFAGQGYEGEELEDFVKDARKALEQIEGEGE